MKGIFNNNGVAAIVVPAQKAIDSLVSSGLTEQQAIDQICAEAEFNASPERKALGAAPTIEQYNNALSAYSNTVTVVADSDVPSDRKWRNAWVFEGGQVKGNSENARQVALARLRGAREPKMAELDIAFMRAAGQGNAAGQQQIEQKKQQLREATDSLNNWIPTTPVMSLASIDAELSPLEVLPDV